MYTKFITPAFEASDMDKTTQFLKEGISNIEQMEILRLAPLDQFGSPVAMIQAFGGRPQYQAALKELAHRLYR
ncbi:type I restriction-modification enzyme R subunit C-terminal domain-containing protein [Azospira sp. I13]|uniref:type I restriction-modification enzyme R subunit C-terminal domain-containing protein n=1 Tax=Azospira sp. I13 TaxID=1765050 RepID=UPI0010578FB1|nr:type I restriction-modification enzyme R subunit C-terminal domain-containing protein [Azospira sp. I13]